MTTIRDVDVSRHRGNARALCLDYGDKRIGVAVSDVDWKIASPLKVINSHGCFPTILSIIDEYSVGLVAVGMPYSLNGGSTGKQREKVEKFIDKLVCLVAQRFTEQKHEETDVLPRYTRVLSKQSVHEDSSSGSDVQETIEMQFGKKSSAGANIQVVTWDERYSSVAANALLSEACASSKTKKACVDKIAASLILQEMLDALAGGMNHDACVLL